MNLRNRKTREIGYYLHTHRDSKTGVLKIAVLKDGVPFSEFKPHEPVYDYDSLAKLYGEWEDYTPAEPYIKDKKVRKFVRDWAEHWKIDEVIIRFIDSNRIDLIGFPSSSSTKTGREIDIQRTVVRNEIVYGNRYTINELCGEEKE